MNIWFVSAIVVLGGGICKQRLLKCEAEVRFLYLIRKW